MPIVGRWQVCVDIVLDSALLEVASLVAAGSTLSLHNNSTQWSRKGERNMNVRAQLVACAGALGLALMSQSAGAFGMMDVGEWKVQFSGNVNGYLSNVDCKNSTGGVVQGGLACGSFGG